MKKKKFLALAACCIGLLTLNPGILLAAPETTRVSVEYGTENGEPDGSSGGRPSISYSGHYVAFSSNATNLVDDDTDTLGKNDIFVRDRINKTTERISVKHGTSGEDSSGDSYHPSISADGRYVAFYSSAKYLVSDTPDPDTYTDIFLRDRINKNTECISVNTTGGEPNGYSYNPSISADGRYVAFHSGASNLIAGDNNLKTDVFVRDWTSDTTELISVKHGGGMANDSSSNSSISRDGRYVAFASAATDIVNTPQTTQYDIFVRDRTSQTTELVSVKFGTADSEPNAESRHPFISANGRYVAFWSTATDLVESDINNMGDIFVFDRQAKTTELVSVNSEGEQQNLGTSGYGGVLSADGRYVAFPSDATNLVENDTNAKRDLFRRDRKKGITIRATVNTAGEEQDGWIYDNYAISGNGQFMAFRSSATNLVEPNDVLFNEDLFLREEEKEFFWPFFLQNFKAKK